MKAKVITLVVLLMVVCSSAQVMIPQLIAVPDLQRSAETNVELTELNISVTVIGGIARTTYDMTFFNSEARVLEGRFQLPLAEGQMVTAFALEVNGEMRDGVIVEKDKGRVVFEEIVRRGIDPGLLEKTEGNVYRARIYPVPANGTKRISITCEEELVGDERGLHYSLPLDTTTTFKSFSVKATVLSGEQKPIVARSGEELLFSSFDNAWIAERSYSNYTPTGSVAFIVPDETDNQVVWTTAAPDGKNYFYIRSRFPIQTEERQWADTVTIMFDRSGSSSFGGSEDLQEILIQLFAQSSVRKLEFVPFHRTVEEAQYFSANAKGVLELLDVITELPNDGATTLGEIDLNNYVGGEAILISDGMNTMGSDSLITAGKAVSVITEGARLNHAALQMISGNSGGSYVNLERHSIAEAISLLSNSSVASDFRTTGSISETYGQLYPTKGIYTLAGQFEGNSSAILLRFSIGDREVSEQTYHLSEAEADRTYSDLITQLWAQRKIAQLCTKGESGRDEVISVAKEYSVVTEYTSLTLKSVN